MSQLENSWFFYWQWANVIAPASYLRGIIYVLIHLSIISQIGHTVLGELCSPMQWVN